MAKKFKDYYDLSTAQLLADKIIEVWTAFPKDKFVIFLESRLLDLEFLQRQDLFVDAFEKYMPGDYKQNIELFKSILGPELDTTTGMFKYGWWLWPVGRYVERHGREDFQISFDFIYELTKHFTGEFAVRPLIEERPEEAFRVIERWSRDSNVHVRRLASECLRIRLPWAKKSLVVLDYFLEYKTILSNLKSDPEKFVQKSVGNNLNDLMKEYPAKAKAIIKEWSTGEISKETKWIIYHGLRSERK